MIQELVAVAKFVVDGQKSPADVWLPVWFAAVVMKEDLDERPVIKYLDLLQPEKNI